MAVGGGKNLKDSAAESACELSDNRGELQSASAALIRGDKARLCTLHWSCSFTTLLASCATWHIELLMYAALTQMAVLVLSKPAFLVAFGLFPAL